MQRHHHRHPAGLWASPAVRIARLGGLCVVAAAGLLAAGALAAGEHTPAILLGVAALILLPGLALGALALHRASRTAH